MSLAGGKADVGLYDAPIQRGCGSCVLSSHGERSDAVRIFGSRRQSATRFALLRSRRRRGLLEAYRDGEAVDALAMASAARSSRARGRTRGRTRGRGAGLTPRHGHWRRRRHRTRRTGITPSVEAPTPDQAPPAGRRRCCGIRRHRTLGRTGVTAIPRTRRDRRRSACRTASEGAPGSRRARLTARPGHGAPGVAAGRHAAPRRARGRGS